MKIDNNTLDSIRKAIRTFDSAVTRAYSKITPDWIFTYWALFVTWCTERGLATFDGVSKDGETKTLLNLKWLNRDPKTNKLPKGTELAWFRFLFDSIPEKREDYRENSLYRTLSQTLHPKAEKANGIKYKKGKAKLPAKKQNDPDVVDDKNTILPTAVKEIDFIMSHGVVQSMLDTIASLIVNLPNGESRLLDYARSRQIPSSWIEILRQAQADHIKREKDIIAAIKEKKSA